MSESLPSTTCMECGRERVPLASDKHLPGYCCTVCEMGRKRCGTCRQDLSPPVGSPQNDPSAPSEAAPGKRD